MLASRLLLALPLLGGATAAATAVPPAAAPPRQESAAESAAEREWEAILDELVPRLVSFKALPEEEKRKQTFRAELARIGDFVRRHQAAEPFLAANARVFMATQILGQALRREREAIEVLRDVAANTSSPVLAGIAAIHAGDFLLRLGDEQGLQELRTLYAARAEREEQCLKRLDELCRQVRLQPGRRFPELELVGLDGRRIEAAALRGTLLVVLVFNLDHEPSRGEFRQLAQLLTARKDPALQALAISVDPDREKVRKEAERLGAAFPIDCSGREWEGPAVQALGVNTIPMTFLLDPEGTILFTRSAVVGVELGAIVDQFLAELREKGELPPKPERR